MIRLAENARLDDNFGRRLLVVSAFVLISSVVVVLNVLASYDFLWGSHCLFGLFLSFRILPLSSSLGSGEDNTGRKQCLLLSPLN